MVDTFSERMIGKTLGQTVQPKRGQNYNYALRWYARTDGEIVQLQSDPQARAYYSDKGFHILADQPGRGEAMSEVEEWERIERPKLIKEQIQRAKYINAIRKTDERNPTLLLDIDDIDHWSLEQLEAEVKDIRERGGKIRLTEPPIPKQPEPMLQGVEKADSLEDLQRKLGADGAQTRTIQGGKSRG